MGFYSRSRVPVLILRASERRQAPTAIVLFREDVFKDTRFKAMILLDETAENKVT